MTKQLAPMPPLNSSQQKIWDEMDEELKAEFEGLRREYLEIYVEGWSEDLPDAERIPLEEKAHFIAVYGTRQAGGL